jgi:RNA 3'-terminal phosphate cyclase (ATP)
VLLLELEAENVTAIFTAFGERGRSSEDVARQAITSARSWLSADVPVDEHLADQLLLPMALAGGGSFRTVKPSPHSMTNATIIERFLPIKIQFKPDGDAAWRVSLQT